MHRIRLAILKFAGHFSRLMAGVAPYAASASAALILWHAASDAPLSGPSSPAPLIYPSRAPLDAASATAAALAVPQTGAPAVQQASVAATIEVVVGRNDTLDASFRRMALDPADLAALSAPQATARSASAQVPAPAASLPATARNSSDAPSRVAVN